MQKKANKPTWWMTELIKLKREAAKLALAYRRNNMETNKEAAKAAKNENRKEMRKSKNKAWRKFCEEREEKNATAKLQNIKKKGKMNEIGTLRNRDSTFTNTTQETLDELLCTLFPDDHETEPYDLTLLVTINMLQNFWIWSVVTPALDYSPAPLGDGTHQPTKKVLVSMDFPPHFDNLALQLMFSHFFLATLSFTITFSIGQTSKNLGHCFVWSNLLLKCKNITQLKCEIVKSVEGNPC